MVEHDCPYCGGGTILYGPDFIDGCEYCGNTSLEKW